MIDGKLEGKTALITGGSRGIGKAIAELFHSEGAKVAINFNSSDGEAKETKDKLTGSEIFKADVSNRDQVRQMLLGVINRFGSLDIVINNAGIIKTMPFEEYDEEKVDMMFNINFKGTLFTILESLKYLKKSKSPVIVNIASNAGIGTALPGTTFYALTKATVIALTKRLSFDLQGSGIRVNAIAPGWIETGMTLGGKSLDEMSKMKEFFENRTTLHMHGSPSHIAKVALFLASDDSKYMNGQVLVVDGGRIDNLTHSV